MTNCSLSMPPPPQIPEFPRVPHKKEKIEFPMPTATNRFQICNLHPKKHRRKKIKIATFFLDVNKTNFLSFVFFLPLLKSIH